MESGGKQWNQGRLWASLVFMKTTTSKMTPAQKRTLEVVRRIGRVPCGASFSHPSMKGYNMRSAEALAKKGLLATDYGEYGPEFYSIPLIPETR